MKQIEEQLEKEENAAAEEAYEAASLPRGNFASTIPPPSPAPQGFTVYGS